MRKVRRRFPGRTLGAMLIGIVLVFAAAGCGDDGGGGGGGGEAITVGSKDFPGAQVISQLYGQALEAKGFDVTYKDNIGPTETVFPLVKKGDLDLYGEYQGTLLTYLKGQPTGDRAETFSALEAKLKGTGLVALGPAPAVDVNGFYVRRETAEKYDLKTVSDLKPVAGRLVFGGPPECLDRPLCLGATEQELYGLDFKEVKKLDAGGPITNKALDDGTIDVGLLFTGSSVIKPDYVLLEDDKGLQPADNPIAVVRENANTTELADVVRSVNEKLTTEAYNEMALRVFNDKEDPATVAGDWLRKEGLVTAGNS
ncbi:MAG: ABC transporter substrate-binding protein [Acidimicrobiia bacterium]|nr:ABC transporter substrate-binding protein [Acidimicrobiia bacterium]